MAVDYSYFPFIPILEAVVCDPAEDPSSCPTNRRCEDEDGDGEYNCVCDKRFYTTHTLGHCVLGKQHKTKDWPLVQKAASASVKVKLGLFR